MDTVVTFTPEAASNIRRAQSRVQELGRAYGEHSPQYTKAAASLAHSLGNLLDWGNARVMAEDEMSLFVSAPGIQFGIIAHEGRIPVEYANLSAPRPVEWSFHS